MDPTACWERMREALIDGDIGEARAAADDLSTWLARGGFMPEVGGDWTAATRRPYVRSVLLFVAGLEEDTRCRYCGHEDASGAGAHEECER